MSVAAATVAALLAAGGVFLVAVGGHRRGLGERITSYLAPAGPPVAPLPIGTSRLGPATAARLGAAAAGAGIGGLLAAGHLFTTAIPNSAPPLIVLGAAAGLLGHRLRRKRAQEGRALRLHRELPTVADTLALSVLAGESVAGAIERFVATSAGVASDELGVVAAEHRAGCGLPEALALAAGRTDHTEAGRLYDLLGHAHRTGGRLADALADLAVDYRAALARDLTVEGGRRALAAYGPILALMVPVTLLFLMYPTLTGLAALSSPSP